MTDPVRPSKQLAVRPSPAETLRGDLPERVRSAIAAHRERGRKYEVLSTEFDKLDVGAEYRYLERELKLDEKRADPDALERAHDEAADNYRRAARLYAAAKGELESLRLTIRAARWPWDRRARASLGQLKKTGDKDGTFSGQVTEALVESWLLAHEPEYFDLRRQEEDLDRHRNALEGFMKAWERRSFSIGLQIKIGLHRRGVSLDALFGGRRPGEEPTDPA